MKRIVVTCEDESLFEGELLDDETGEAVDGQVVVGDVRIGLPSPAVSVSFEAVEASA